MYGSAIVAGGQSFSGALPRTGDHRPGDTRRRERLPMRRHVSDVRREHS